MGRSEESKPMPLVEVDSVMPAPVSRVWELINDVEAYPRLMDHVRSLAVLERGQTYRLTAWEIDCHGFIMRWVEREEIDPERYRIDYHQEKGDLAVFEGVWQVEAISEEISRVMLSVRFEIGVPMLSEMLNPVAERAIRENSQKMLLSLASEMDRKQDVKELG